MNVLCTTETKQIKRPWIQYPWCFISLHDTPSTKSFIRQSHLPDQLVQAAHNGHRTSRGSVKPSACPLRGPLPMSEGARLALTSVHPGQQPVRRTSLLAVASLMDAVHAITLMGCCGPLTSEEAPVGGTPACDCFEAVPFFVPASASSRSWQQHLRHTKGECTVLRIFPWECHASLQWERHAVQAMYIRPHMCIHTCALTDMQEAPCRLGTGAQQAGLSSSSHPETASLGASWT